MAEVVKEVGIADVVAGGEGGRVMGGVAVSGRASPTGAVTDAALAYQAAMQEAWSMFMSETQGAQGLTLEAPATAAEALTMLSHVAGRLLRAYLSEVVAGTKGEGREREREGEREGRGESAALDQQEEWQRERARERGGGGVGGGERGKRSIGK